MMSAMNDTRAVEDQLIHHTGQCARFGCDMLIVDGGSHDGTGEVAKRYGKVMAAPGSVNAGAAVSGMTLIS